MMKGWKEVELNEVAPYWVEKIDASELDETNFISADNMKTDKGGIVNSDYVPKSGKSTHFERNDILISNIRPYFKKIWFAKFDGGCSNDVIVFRTNRKIADSKFIYYSLAKDDFFDYMMAGANGTKMPRGNKKSIPMYKINLPPLPTQRKIAGILSAYDDLIENNLKRIKLLEEKAQLTYEEWFVRMKFPGHETTPINEETGLPEGWEKKNFEDVIDFKEGPGLRNWQYRDEGIPFLNIRVIKDGDVDMSKVQYLDPEEVKMKYNHFLLEENDHVISSSGTLGRLTTIRKCHLPLCLNTSIIRMRSKNEKFGKWLIKHTLLGKIFQTTMEIYANGSAQVNFGPTHLKQIKLPIPSSEIAVRFERIIEPHEEHIKLLRDKNQYLKEARDILLPRLMTGMIDVDEMEGVV